MAHDASMPRSEAKPRKTRKTRKSANCVPDADLQQSEQAEGSGRKRQKSPEQGQQLSDPERQAVALDAVRQKVEAGDTWTRPADADVRALTTQRDAALRREDFRQAEVIKERLEAVNNRGANWFDAQSGQWRVQDGFDDVNAPIWRDRAC